MQAFQTSASFLTNASLQLSAPTVPARGSPMAGFASAFVQRISSFSRFRLPTILTVFTVTSSALLMTKSEKVRTLEKTESKNPFEWQSASSQKDGQRFNLNLEDLNDMAIFSGRANPELAAEIARAIGVPLGKISIRGFADGEIGIQVNENVRGKDVYIIQPTSPPRVNDNIMELLLMISTMRRASARKITAVIPYYGYARQDRKMASRVPISAADLAALIQAMGVDRVVAVDLHSGQTQGFFSPRTPCDNLEAHVVALPWFRDLDLQGDSTKIVSPDAGGVYRAKRFRDGLNSFGIDAGLAMIVKQRVKANQIERMDLVGSVDGCDVIIVDDMIDTAGTLTSAADELKSMGAKHIYAFATHGVFSDPAISRINASQLEKVVVCNTVPLQPAGKQSPKIVQLSVAELIAEAIARIHLKRSVSALFEK